MNVLGTINITEKQMAFEKKPNCKFTCAQVIQMMILFPFFSIKNAANIALRSDARNSEYPICMIVDDTDMPKTGRKGEMLGRVYSHVENRGSILGHKGLFFCRTDGRTQMLIDFTLLGVEGRVSSRIRYPV